MKILLQWLKRLMVNMAWVKACYKYNFTSPYIFSTGENRHINQTGYRFLLMMAFVTIQVFIAAQPVNLASAEKKTINSSDTNGITRIIYPPLTQREGKDVQLPLPPAQHPRLYLSAKDIPVLQQQLNHPLLQKCRSKIMQAAAFETDGIMHSDTTKSNNSMAVRDAIEAKALMYVLYQNEKAGKDAVAAVLKYFSTLQIDPKLPDVTRDIGRAIVTGSIVYDWCYPLLLDSQKTILIGRMEACAAQMEIQWPQIKGSSITGHTTEAQMARDMLSLGIATFNEKPVIYNRVAGRIFSEFLTARQFFYPAGYHHQGSAYGAYRFYWDMFSTFTFSKMGYENVYGKNQSQVPYYFIYGRRPDGQLIRDGDDYNEQFTLFGKWWNLGQIVLLVAGSYYNNPVMINEGLKERSLGETTDYLFDFLFFNLAAYRPEQTKVVLPLTRYFPEPYGAMIARTGWQDGIASNDVVAKFKIQSYNFSNHQHLDAGSFQLYYKGPLTVQSGIYQGTAGGYGSNHFKNYSQRTIAHNTMLIYDPAEQFTWNKSEIINDGGQPYPNKGQEPENMQELLTQGYQTGEVLAHHFGPDTVRPEYTYLKGELAKAYGKKVKSFQRSFVFLDLKNSGVPAALVVYDKVEAADSNFRKTWLLHCVEEPRIQGNTTTISRTERGYNGRLVNTTLLPEITNLDIRKRGGAGNEFSVQNKNFPQAITAANNSWDSAVWRIEVSPKKASLSDNFLNVMQVMDASGTIQPFAIQKVETNLFTGAGIGDRMVLFSKSGEPVAKSFSITITGAGYKKILITDVQKGVWKISNAAGKKLKPIIVNNTEQLIYFRVKSGTYVITMQ